MTAARPSGWVVSFALSALGLGSLGVSTALVAGALVALVALVAGALVVTLAAWASV